jgi:hypothetical protein
MSTLNTSLDWGGDDTSAGGVTQYRVSRDWRGGTPVMQPDEPAGDGIPYRYRVLRDPQSIPELAAVLAAIKAGAKRSKFRLLDIACKKQHRLAEVYATGAGPVLLGFGRLARWEDGVGKDGFGAVPMSELGYMSGVWFQCRCTSQDVHANWIRVQLEQKRRRANFGDPKTWRPAAYPPTPDQRAWVPRDHSEDNGSSYG